MNEYVHLYSGVPMKIPLSPYSSCFTISRIMKKLNIVGYRPLSEAQLICTTFRGLSLYPISREWLSVYWHFLFCIFHFKIGGDDWVWNRSIL